MSTALHYLTVSEASALILSRRLSPVDLVEAFLRRIEEIDGEIHSYLTVVADRARAAARRAEDEIAAGRWRGPLHGIPFAVKDNYHTIGIPTIAASRLMADYMPTETATHRCSARASRRDPAWQTQHVGIRHGNRCGL